MQCETCGNDYDKAFIVKHADGSEHAFDSFQCAIQALAPVCPACSSRLVNPGFERDGVMYCCVHCARQSE